MRIEPATLTGMIAVAFLAASPGISSSIPAITGVSTQMVITVRPAPGDDPGEHLSASDLRISTGNIPAHVVRFERLAGELADMQLFVLLDDSTRSSSLGDQLRELKAFLAGLPASTQVAVGYMRNGTFTLDQPFTADHEKAASALRLPQAIAGGNGSPYFVLSDLAKRWPSKQPSGRRAVLMLTDGVDRYYGAPTEDDPYVDTAIHEALKSGVMVYSIYLRGAGVYGGSGWDTNVAQSRLMQISQGTGGYAYFQGFGNPVSVSPFLSDFRNRLDNQYQVTMEASNQKGVQPVKLRAELRGLKIQAPTLVYLR